MEEIIMSFFVTLLSIGTYIGFFILIRKLVLWYWKVDRLTRGVENMYELQLLLQAEEIQKKRLTFINLATKTDIEMSIKDYLNKDNKHNYKIK